MADEKNTVDPALSRFYKAMEKTNAEKIANEMLRRAPRLAASRFEIQHPKPAAPNSRICSDSPPTFEACHAQLSDPSHPVTGH